MYNVKRQVENFHNNPLEASHATYDAQAIAPIARNYVVIIKIW